MEEVQLSKRRPPEEKLFCWKEKKEFYEEKKIPAPSKKSSTLRSSLLSSRRQDFFQKLACERIKNISNWRGLGWKLFIRKWPSESAKIDNLLFFWGPCTYDCLFATFVGQNTRYFLHNS